MYFMKLQLLFLFFFLTSFVHAHEIRPALIDLTQIDLKHFNLSIESNTEAMMVGMGSEHNDTDASPLNDDYNRLRALDTDAFRHSATLFAETIPSKIAFTNENAQPVSFDYRLEEVHVSAPDDPGLARNTTITFSLTTGASFKTIQFRWPEAWGNSVLRISNDHERIATLWVDAGAVSQAATMDVLNQHQSWVEYIIIGFEHILPLGLDHILFVIGLFLLSQKLSALLWQVTAFTVAHTITLALATLGIITLSPSIVEPLIAASITYVAVENLIHHNVTRLRIAVVFMFGLLHGLGFAGVLGEIGLNPGQFITSLISFNIGVELGQLAVIALMFLLFESWLGKTDYWENWFRKPLSVVIAATGIFWFIQRLL